MQNFVSISSGLGGCGSRKMEIPSKYIRSVCTSKNDLHCATVIQLNLRENFYLTVTARLYSIYKKQTALHDPFPASQEEKSTIYIQMCQNCQEVQSRLPLLLNGVMYHTRLSVVESILGSLLEWFLSHPWVCSHVRFSHVKIALFVISKCLWNGSLFITLCSLHHNM